MSKDLLKLLKELEKRAESNLRVAQDFNTPATKSYFTGRSEAFEISANLVKEALRKNGVTL